MIRNRTIKMVAKTMMGLEEVLAGELTSLGADNIEIGNRMVSFEGDLALMYKANFHCRTALRILRTVYTFRAKTPDDIYKKIKAMNWSEHLSADSTFAIDAVVFSNYFPHSQFTAFRVKDAIADYFTQRDGKRPSVDIKSPDLLINFHVANDVCTVSFDSSGESLHKRGYKFHQKQAHLNEILAAGILLKAGWDGKSVLIDPMCGSGTFLIEAAMIALNVPPGIYRQGYAFEKWANFDKELFDNIYEDDSNERPFDFKIYGADISPQAIEITQQNIKEAGLDKHISLEVRGIEDWTEAPTDNGLVVTNPPYGERLQPEDLLGLYNRLGERLKHVFMGYKVCVLGYTKECFNEIGLKQSSRYKLLNGSLECEVRTYNIFAGKKKELNTPTE